MFRLSVLLCLSLYCAMVIWGNGPDRMARHAGAEVAAAPVTSGIRVLPAPPRIVIARPAPQPARDPTVPVTLVATLPAAPTPPAAEPVAEPPLAAAHALATNMQLARIGDSTANVRAAPTKRSALSGKVAAGGAVLVMWTEPNGWVRVRSADGAVDGFVHESLLAETPPLELATAD